MSDRMKWALRIGGAVLVMVSAVAVLFAPNVLWFTVPVICVWACWLIYDYMQWARTLGR
jgi:hypothetical protein